MARLSSALRQNPRIQMFSSLKPGETWGLATVGIQGMEASKISTFLMDKYRIIVNAAVGGRPPAQVFDYQGLRVTPNVYTTLQEIDTFVAAMQDALKSGVAPRVSA